MIKYLVFLVFAAIALSISTAKASDWPICESCLPDESIIEPGVGIELSLDYGTIAIRFHNGSNVPIAKIQGSPAYRSNMRDLLSGSRAHDHPPLLTQQSKQYLPKLIQSLAAHLSTSVSAQRPVPSVLPPETTIFEMITALTQHAAPSLQKPITHVTIATPIFLSRAQWTHHFAPAASRAGLKPIGALTPDTNTMEAAVAADGYMMCPDYTDVPSCYDEIDSFPFEHIMAVEYSDCALSALFSYSMDAPDDTNSFVDTTLGAAHLAADLTSSTSSFKDYWLRLRQRLRNLFQAGGGNIERLVLVGENATTEDFLYNMRSAFADPIPLLHTKDLLQSRLDESRMLDPLFASALGAAEIAKRAMESPNGCVEEQECVDRRKRLSGS